MAAKIIEAQEHLARQLNQQSLDHLLATRPDPETLQSSGILHAPPGVSASDAAIAAGNTQGSLITNAVLSGGGYSDAIAASTTQTITVELFDGMVPPNPTVVPEGETVQFDVRSFPTQATQYMSHTKIAPGKYEVTYQVGSPQVIGLSNDVKSSQIDLVVDFGYGTGDAAVPQQTGVPKSIEVFADPGEIAAAACVASYKEPSRRQKLRNDGTWTKDGVKTRA